MLEGDVEVPFKGRVGGEAGRDTVEGGKRFTGGSGWGCRGGRRGGVGTLDSEGGSSTPCMGGDSMGSGESMSMGVLSPPPPRVPGRHILLQPVHFVEQV